MTRSSTEVAAMPDLLTTFAEAERVNPYTLARRWAEQTAGPPRVPAAVAAEHGIEARTLPHELDELATMAALQTWLLRWLPLQIHRVLLDGAGIEPTAAACGLPPAQLAAAWRQWSTRQRHLQRQMPGMQDRGAEYDAVEAILRDGGRR